MESSIRRRAVGGHRASARSWVVLVALLLVAGLVGPGSAPTPHTPCIDSVVGPTSLHLCITGPGDGAQVSGIVPVSATVEVTGRDSVRAVEFSLDGVYVLADQEPDRPFTRRGVRTFGFDLPSARWPDGPKYLGARALLHGGAVSERATVQITLSNGGAGPPPNTGTFSPPDVVAAPGRPLVIGAVGDGANGLGRERAVTNMIASWNPDLFLYLGDVYLEGTDAEFYNWYGHDGAGVRPFHQLYERFREITAPTVGNHEYYGPEGEVPYADYWNMGATARHYYSFDAGGWHFISLDSTGTGQYDQTALGTPQYEWLAADLAGSDRRGDLCTLVYFHHPMWHKTGQFVSRLAPWWSLFASHGVEIVLNGHIHDYERWQPLNANGEPLPGGVTQIVAGMGGESPATPFTSSAQGPEVRANWSGSGALKLRLYPGHADFGAYSTTDTSTPLDSSTSAGPIACHGPPVDTAPPTSPSISVASATSSRVHLAWTPAIDRIGVSAYDIFRDGAKAATTGGMTTMYIDTDVHGGEIHTYKIVARDAAGNASASEPVDVKVASGS
jgi:hypothetical protein